MTLPLIFFIPNGIVMANQSTVFLDYSFYVYVSVGAQALVIVRIHGTLEILPKRGECENFLV